MLKRKLIQFGDTLSHNFVFPPYEESENYDSDYRIPQENLVGKDGSYLSLYNKGLKNPITITKTFKLHSPELDYKWNMGCSCNCACEDKCKLKSGWEVSLTDYMYRGLYSGLQNMYFMMEDGTVRVTRGITQSISFENSYETTYREVSVTFLIPDPFFYQVDSRKTLWYDCIPFDRIVCGCDNPGGYFPKSTLSGCCNLMLGCLQSGIILYDDDFYKKFPNLVSIPDPTYIDSNSYYIKECVDGSAGSGQLCLKFIGDWTNPKITNPENNTYFQLNTSMNSSHYFEICISNYDDCGSYIADITDAPRESNLPVTDTMLSSSNNLFSLISGNQKLHLEGAGTNSYFLLTYLNKYH